MLFNPLRSLFWLLFFFFLWPSQENIPSPKPFRLDAVATIYSHQRRCSSVSPNDHCFWETAARSSLSNTRTQQKRQSSWQRAAQLLFKIQHPFPNLPKKAGCKETFILKKCSCHLTSSICSIPKAQDTCHSSPNSAEWEKADGGNNNC